MIRKSDSMPMYTMLCETSNPREAVSRASKFVIVATIGLLLALIEQVVGYSTNYWMKKGFGSSVYHTEGLWKTCYCSSSCYCDTRDTSGDNRIRVACVFETLGLAGLVAVLVLTFLGVFMKNYKTIIKVASAVAGFVTSALILAGVVGIGVTAASDAYITLHFSFALCAKAGGMTLLSAFLLIVDIRPRYRATEYRDYSEETKATETKKQLRQKAAQRPTTLGEYLNQRNTEPDDDHRHNTKAEYLGRRKQKPRHMKQQSETDQYSNKGYKEDKYAYDDYDDKDGGFAQRNKTDDKFQNKQTREDKRTYRNHSAEVYGDADGHNRPYLSEASREYNAENGFNEVMQYAKMNRLRNEFEDEEKYLGKYEDNEYSNPKMTEENVAQKVAQYAENQTPQNYSRFGELPTGQYKYQKKYSGQVDRNYQRHDKDPENNIDFNQSAVSHVHSNNKIPQLNRSPNASETRRQNNWASQYEPGNKNDEYYGNQPVQVVQNYRRCGQVDYYSSQPSPPRNSPDSYHGKSDPYDNQSDSKIVLPSSYSDSQEASHSSRSRQDRSNETTV